MNNRSIYKEAKKNFFESGKLLCSAIGFCVVLFSAVMALVAADVVSMAVSAVIDGDTVLALSMYAAIAVVLVFVTMPVFLGYIELLYAIYKGERDVYVIDVFKNFAPRRYFKTLFFGVRFLIRGCFTFLLPLFIALGAYFALQEAVKGMYFERFSVLFKVPAVLIFLFFYLLFSLSKARGLLGVFYRLEGVKHPYKQSKKALNGKVMRTFWLKMMFVFMTVISVLSLGMLFLITVPIMANAYFIYAKQITENINE